MIKPDLTMTPQIVQAAIVFEQRQTGHVPQAVTLRPNEDTPVVSRREDLAPSREFWKEVDDVDLTENAMTHPTGGAAFAVHRQ